MRENLRLELAALAVVVILGLLSAWPYLQNPGLPADTDAELHIYRIAELGYSLRAGRLYPRWAPDFYHGYGYPIFNYYAPLAYYVGYGLTLGEPENAALGARLLALAIPIIGAVGAYHLGKLFGGRGGGLLGSAAFSLAPYIQLINPHLRGDIPESFALAWVPWALWSWELLWREEGASKRAILLPVLATSAVFLSHNLTGLTAVVLLGALSLYRWGGRRHRVLLRAVGVGLLFVSLTAFFWLPFLVERSAIQLDVAGEGHYDFRNHFVSPKELLSRLRPIDRRATAADVPMTLGPHLALLAAAGGLWSAYGSVSKECADTERTTLRDTGFYLIAMALLGWLMTRSSQRVWEGIPGLAYFQFPWRFLGPLAAVMVPPVAAVAGLGREIQGRASGCPGTLAPFGVGFCAIALMAVGSLPGLFPLPWEPGFGRITPADIIEAELRGRWRGTTSTNDFVPSTVDVIPGPQDSVLASYQNPPVDRVNRHTLPSSTSLRIIPDKPWVNRYEVATEVAFTLRLYLFQFPGWRAYVDGERVSIELARPEGFITVPVPAGHHDVVVRFGTTAARLVAWLVSGAGLVGLGVVVGRQRRPAASQVPRDSRDRNSARWTPVAWGALVGLGSLLVIVVLSEIGLLEGMTWLGYTSPPGVAWPAQYQQQADLSGQAMLLGYDLSAKQVWPGHDLDVTPFWTAQRTVTKTYQSFVHLVYPEGEIVTQSDHLNPGGFPTNLWPADRYVRDRHRLTIPEDLAPGTYLLSVGLYTLADNERLPVVSATCGRRADSVILCQPITVRR
ncbi:MAG: 6-pyruvoyl-tetrahydropterin synthase-related protein [Anaerolineae bacterium]